MHQIVKFVSPQTAIGLIEAKRCGEITVKVEEANPFPSKPDLPNEFKQAARNKAETNAREKVVLDMSKAYEEACAQVKAERVRLIALEMEAMEHPVLIEEEGHPELPDDHVVRSRTEARCRRVGCPNGVIPHSGKHGVKDRRHSHAFCRSDSWLRREIPRKGGYFEARTDGNVGIRVVSAEAETTNVAA